jgi:hypothetical protein
LGIWSFANWNINKAETCCIANKEFGADTLFFCFLTTSLILSEYHFSAERQPLRIELHLNGSFERHKKCEMWDKM